MEHQRPRTWPARLGIAALCGLLVAVVSLVGYEPNPRNAGAAIQPAPTSIAFVPMHPEPPLQARAVQAGRMMSLLPSTSSELIAPAGGPEPAAALLPDAEACSFPCFDPDSNDEPETEDDVEDVPKSDPVPEPAPVAGSETGETVETGVDGADEPSEQVVDLGDDGVEIDLDAAE